MDDRPSSHECLLDVSAQTQPPPLRMRPSEQQQQQQHYQHFCSQRHQYSKKKSSSSSSSVAMAGRRRIWSLTWYSLLLLMLLVLLAFLAVHVRDVVQKANKASRLKEYAKQFETVAASVDRLEVRLDKASRGFERAAATGRKVGEAVAAAAAAPMANKVGMDEVG